MAVKENNKYLYAIAVVSANILFVLIMFFLLKGMMNKNKKISAEVNANKQKLEVLEDKLSKLKDLKGKEKELLEEKKRLLSALPEKKDIPRLFVQFEKMVETTGSKVSSATGGAGSAQALTTVQEIPGITTYDYEIKATTTTYESFKNVVLNSENALRLLNITGFTIATKDNKSFDVSFSLKAYGRMEENK